MNPIKPQTQRALELAMERLLLGKPIKTDGRLTVTNLAKEANISRATANRAIDILTKFREARDKIDNQGYCPKSLKARIKELEQEIKSLKSHERAELVKLRKDNHVLAQHIQILTLQIQQQEEFISKIPKNDNVVVWPTNKS